VTAHDPSHLPDTHGLPVVGPDYWRFAQVKDWMLLCEDIPHVDIRVYGVFRSLAANAPRGRRLSKDEIRWLVPGVNGKPMSMRTLEESLRRLAASGLVVAEHGNVNTRSARNSQGRWERVETLLWRVNELPAEGEDYQGWHTVQEGLDAYPGPGWDERDTRRPAPLPEDPDDRGPGAAPPAPRTPEPGRGDRARKTADGPARSEQPKRRVAAGRTARAATRKSALAARKTADRARKSSDDTRADQREPDAPNLFTNRPYIPTPLPPDDPTGSQGGGAGTQAGRDGTPDDDTALRAAAFMADWALPRSATPPTLPQRATLIGLIADLWALGVSNTDIRATATANTDNVRWAGSVWIARLSNRADHIRANPTATPPPATPPQQQPSAPAGEDAPGRVAARNTVRDLRKVHKGHREPAVGRGR
jgi:hypothetical protein